MTTSQKSYTYYHAGPLFSLSDLHTNTLLASRIDALSSGKYIPIVPQDLEQRDTSPHSIRDQDIRSLLACDLALFTYDGAELDSGTVVEFMFAKFADIPCVILRTDFRKAGDQAETYGEGTADPWNLMSSFYPRTKRVVVDAMMGYKTALARAQGRTGAEGEGEDVINVNCEVALQAGEILLEETATRVVAAMDETVKTPSTMPKEAQDKVYGWLGLMPGFKSGGEAKQMLDLLRRKEEKGLL